MDRNLIIGRTIVVLFFTTAIVTAVGAMFIINNSREAARANQAVFGLQQIQKSARQWAESDRGRYPVHVALLWSNSFAQARHFKDPRAYADTVWSVGSVDARPYVEEFRDDAKDEDRLDRQPLIEAVNSTISEPLYRFGDYEFARIPRFENSDALLFGWTRPDDAGRRFVVFDNGDARKVDSAGWDEVWKRDADAREKLGLPAVAPPAE